MVFITLPYLILYAFPSNHIIIFILYLFYSYAIQHLLFSPLTTTLTTAASSRHISLLLILYSFFSSSTFPFPSLSVCPVTTTNYDSDNNNNYYLTACNRQLSIRPSHHQSTLTLNNLSPRGPLQPTVAYRQSVK